MKQFTKKGKKSRSLILLIIPVIFALLITGCSTSDNVQSFRKNSQDEKVFSFTDYQSGDETNWKVYFKDDKISELYKNGNKIPEDDIDNYSSMIYDKISDIADFRKDRNRVKVFGFDGDGFKMEMKHLDDELKKQNGEIRFKIKKDMDKLAIEMDSLKNKDFLIRFKPEFDKNMKHLKKEMRKLRKDSSDAYVFRFEGKQLEKELRDLAENLKDVEIDIDFDLPEINIDLSDVDESLRELDIELKSLDEDLEKLDKFFEELKKEMVSDGLLNSVEDEVSIKFEDEKLYINDKEVPEQLKLKYKRLYKEHTGKDFKGSNFFHFKNK